MRNLGKHHSEKKNEQTIRKTVFEANPKQTSTAGRCRGDENFRSRELCSKNWWDVSTRGGGKSVPQKKIKGVLSLEKQQTTEKLKERGDPDSGGCEQGEKNHPRQRNPGRSKSKETGKRKESTSPSATTPRGQDAQWVGGGGGPATEGRRGKKKGKGARA